MIADSLAVLCARAHIEAPTPKSERPREPSNGTLARSLFRGMRAGAPRTGMALSDAGDRTVGGLRAGCAATGRDFHRETPVDIPDDGHGLDLFNTVCALDSSTIDYCCAMSPDSLDNSVDSGAALDLDMGPLDGHEPSHS